MNIEIPPGTYARRVFYLDVAGGEGRWDRLALAGAAAPVPPNEHRLAELIAQGPLEEVEVGAMQGKK